MSTARDRMIQKLRKALQHKVEAPFKERRDDKAIFPKEPEDLSIQFAEALHATKGNFIYCEDEEDLVHKLKELTTLKSWRHLYCWHPELQHLFEATDFRACRIGRQLDRADAGVTTCEALVARTGSVLLSSKQAGGRSLSIFPPVHIVIATTNQLVPDIDDALKMINTRYGEAIPSMLCLTSGPSRTADIEKTLVMGAHGPAALYVFLLDRTND